VPPVDVRGSCSGLHACIYICAALDYADRFDTVVSGEYQEFPGPPFMCIKDFEEMVVYKKWTEAEPLRIIVFRRNLHLLVMACKAAPMFLNS
jgi:hypothetical protein